VVLVAVPGPAVIEVLQAAGPLDGRIVTDAANSSGQQQVTLRSLADMADDNHREPTWVAFLSGDEEAKPVVAQLIRDAGFDPVDLGGIDDSRIQDPGGAVWLNILTHDEATALLARIKSGDMAAADQSALRTRTRQWKTTPA
jgi:predicted dinucleotide-binding enzyme